MRRSAKAFTAVIAIGALLTLAGCTEAASTQSHQAAASSQTTTLAAQITTADESEGMAHAQLASLQLDVKGMQSVLAARPAFLAAVAKAKASFDAAAGKVDVTSEHQTVLAAQQQVLAERTDPATVDAATKAVLDAAASANAKLASYRAQPAPHRASKPAPKAAASAAAPMPAPASGDWFAQMRAILTEVGGSGIQLVQYDGHCGGVVAAACSVQGTVKVNPSIASWSQSRKVWAMTHELAHQYQFKVWAALLASPTYHSLYGGNIELLANCQAAAHGHPSPGGHCTSAQVAWANNIWNGVVPN